MTIEQEILRVEREYWQLGDPGALAKRLAAFEQSLAASWMYAALGTTAPAPNSTFSGNLKKCDGSTGIGSGIAIAIKDGGGATLWTGATTNTAGSFSGSLFLASTATLTVFVDPPNARWANPSSFSASFTAGGSTSLATRVITPATGYACFLSGQCVEPIPTVLHLTSDGACSGGIYPSDTLTYQARPAVLATAIGAGFSWIGATTITKGGFNDWLYFFNGGPGLSIFRTSNGSTTALVSTSTATCPVVPGTTYSYSVTCGGLNLFGGSIAE